MTSPPRPILHVPPSLPLLLLTFLSLPDLTNPEPLSHPYVPYRTTPYPQHTAAQNHNFPNVTLGKRAEGGQQQPGSRSSDNKNKPRGRAKVRPVEVSPASPTKKALENGGDPRCPLALRVGLTHRSHHSSSTSERSGMHTPPITFPAHPHSGPGREVIFATDWEHLDMLTPNRNAGSTASAVVESLSTDAQFPLLFEGSNFYHTSPLLHDENGDGVMDATLIDYDGGMYTVGLDYSPTSSSNGKNGVGERGGKRERYVKTAQVPRLYLRKDWVESATNTTLQGVDPNDYNAQTYTYPPYHSYFEYGTEWKEDVLNKKKLGVVSGNVVEQSVEEVTDLEKRMMERWKVFEEEHTKKKEEDGEEEGGGEESEMEKKEGEGEGEGEDEKGGGDGNAVGSAEKGGEEKKEGGEGGGKHDEQQAGEGEAKSDEAPKEAETVHSDGDAVRGDRRRRLQEEEEVPNGGSGDDQSPEKDEQEKEEQEKKEVIDAIPVGKRKKKEGDENNNHKRYDSTQDRANDALSDLDEHERAHAHAHATVTDETVDVTMTHKGDAKKPYEPINTTDPHTGYCGDCYGAAELPNPPDECCNTCDDIRRVYARKNWGFKNADFEQCIREGLLNGTDSDAELKDEGGGYHDYDGDYTDDVDRAYPHDDMAMGDYGGGDDEYGYGRRRGGHYGDDAYVGDDYYGRDSYHNEEHTNFYSDENYIRVPPHVLADPVHVEIPKRYKASGDDEHAVEEFLVVAASYYLDEDEFDGGGLQSYRRFQNRDGGDESETARGQYVSSALLMWNRKYDQWSTQTHLDLSTDWTAPLNTTVGDAPVHGDNHNGFAALALASPTVVSFDLDDMMNAGQAKYCVVLGTSMGLLYVLDIPSGSRRDGFPVRFPYPIVRRTVVEDVVGDTKPEMFAVDKGGNLACLDSGGGTVWHRDLIEEEGSTWSVRGTSEMTLGDVNGDGTLDVVIVVRLSPVGSGKLDEMRIYALDATSGDDIPRFPMSIEVRPRSVNGMPPTDADDDLPLPQPLLVDLHESQGHWIDRIRKFGNATNTDPKAELEREAREVRKINDEAATGPLPGKGTRIPHGGMGRGLHIVQPIQSHLYIIEGGTGCTQTINIGDDVPTMVQVDDVHGTETLDLIVSTASGQVLTLEVSDSVPFHPLNVWNTGSVRSRINGHAQGYSASSGIFVHEKSRRYRNWLGIYVTVTFEIFDRRPGIWREPDARKYLVDIRCGTSNEKAVMRQLYNSPGIYTERIFIPYGVGYYSLVARLTTTNGLVYEDVFSVGYNVNYSTGLAWVVLLPLLLSAIPLLSLRRKPNWQEDDDFSADGRGSHGILG